MISVENFYWILYKILLKPCGLDCWYYYPFGTKNNLSRTGEFQTYDSKLCDNHVLFHYDQEPIWTPDLGHLYDMIVGVITFSNKRCKIIASSEISDMKRYLIQNRGLLSWYFFYHGFAALDWYHDVQYIDQNHDVDWAFLSFNHIISHYRSYRISLLARLLQRDIACKGRISWHSDFDDTMYEINNPNNLLSDKSRALCHDTFKKQSDLPWKLDDVEINGNMSAHFGHREFKLWQQSLLHVVNETVFYQIKLHLTEKTFKPIVVQRPFVLVAAPGNLRYLRSYGFRTFEPWIDESYDDIQDPDQRLDAIASEVAKFASMSLRELRNIHHDMQPILDYNKRHFFGEFRRIIVNELVDNFDQCIRIWNNGRVDGRELPIHPDLDSVKQLLLN